MLFGNFAESRSKDLKEAIGENEYAKDYGYISDSDLEDDEDEKPTLKHASTSKSHPFDPFSTPGEDKLVHEEYEERIGKGKVVKIPDVAFVTLVHIGDLHGVLLISC